MSSILSFFLSFLLVYKYFALFGIAFIAALILPVPSSTTLVAAGAFAYQGYLNFLSVVGVAFLGNISGDATGYLLSKRYGEELLKKVGFRKLIASRKFKQLEEYFTGNAGPLIFFTRFMTEAGPAVNILAGLAQVPPKKYFPYALSGEFLYVLIFGSVGYYLGSTWENSVGFPRSIAFFMTLLGLLFFLGRMVFMGRMQKRQKCV